MHQEELHCFQRSRANWLLQGERNNTKYFHTSATIKRAKNKILSLKNTQDQRLTDTRLLEEMARKFYMELYTANPITSQIHGPDLLPTLSHADQRLLNRPVSLPEVHRALLEIGPNKASGSDGLLPAFLQYYWDILHPSIWNLVQQAFLRGAFSTNLSTTFITLIPKQTIPELISHFRPIALCNVVVKIITKIIANGLKSLMDKLLQTSPNQCSFIPCRQAIDNIALTQELIHFMRQKTGKKGWMALKLDLVAFP